jgi:hypothetical protein
MRHMSTTPVAVAVDESEQPPGGDAGRVAAAPLKRAAPDVAEFAPARNEIERSDPPRGRIGVVHAAPPIVEPKARD